MLTSGHYSSPCLFTDRAGGFVLQTFRFPNLMQGCLVTLLMVTITAVWVIINQLVTEKWQQNRYGDSDLWTPTVRDELITKPITSWLVLDRFPTIIFTQSIVDINKYNDCITFWFRCKKFIYRAVLQSVMKIVGYQIFWRITRYVTLVIRQDYQKFCLRSTPGVSFQQTVPPAGADTSPCFSQGRSKSIPIYVHHLAT